MELTVENILLQYSQSGKKHLIVTGWRGKGKTTLLKRIVKELSNDILPGLTSYMVPKTGVILRDNITGKEDAIGVYCPEKAEIGRNMLPYSDGFYTVGIPAMEYAVDSKSEWVFMDEIGFLESRETEFQQSLLKTMEQKQFIAAVRKEAKGRVPFIDTILSRNDVFIIDLDDYDSSDYWG